MGVGKRDVRGACGGERELWEWVKCFLGVGVPRGGICEGHVGPFEYLRRAYFEPGGDLVVWGPRGGGKTRLGAVATVLDLVHKPGVQVRILGGSLEQSGRMWGHVVEGLERLPRVGEEVWARAREVETAWGSGCAVLTQSEKSVRGVRVQKLRCDEVELFDRDVWEAAQLVTKSMAVKVGEDDAVVIRGAVEALSTMHRAGGVMAGIVDGAAARRAKVLKWCLMEVLERCPAERVCAGCPLWDECGGRAKNKESGFVTIEDAIRMKGRVSVETWEAEMLCKRPSTRGCVFPRFREEVHVREEVEGLSGEMSMGVDFGFAAPFVCLWMRGEVGGRVQVVDEYVQPGRTIVEHASVLEGRGWGTKKMACDPAGAGVSDQTAVSNIQYLKSRGFGVKSRRSGILEGVEKIREGLQSGVGEVKLFVHPRCKKLIEAMKGYRYGEGGSELPLKDGVHDHLVDALRYWYVNGGRKEEGGGRRY